MKKSRKLKAISICMVLTLAYFWNYGLTHPQFVSIIVSAEKNAAGKIILSNFSEQVYDILYYIFKL